MPPRLAGLAVGKKVLGQDSFHVAPQVGRNRRLLGYAEAAPAYPGAKNSWMLPSDSLRDDPERVIDIFQATADALPASVSRRKLSE
jgi:hypothetical protein